MRMMMFNVKRPRINTYWWIHSFPKKTSEVSFMNTVKVCENGLQAKGIINQLTAEGYDRENIYVFAHGEEREKDLADALETGKVGISEQGLVNTVTNVFRERGDELRSELEAVGLTEIEAEKYEKVLDGGEIVLVAKK